jgi:C4-dicarboxylate-specific signal transduction histidine kinase
MKLADERESIIKELEIYQMASYNAEVGVWDFDIKTQKTWWDDILFKIYELDKENYKDDAVPLDTFMKMVVPEDLESLNKDINKTIETGESMDLMFRIKTPKTNRIKYIRSKGKVLTNSSGEITNIYGTNWDVSKEMSLAEERQEALEQLRETQSQLIQSEKMASLGVLTAGMAHELNNPLNYIVGGYTAIKEQFEENKLDKEELKEFLRWIKAGTDRATNIVKSLNLFSKSSDDKSELCEINSIIDNCLVMLQNKYKTRLEIIKNYTGESTEITGNNTRLHQVFLNILANAMDAIEKEGTIIIKTLNQNNKVVIEIKDNGKGIQSESVDKVMDPFYTTKPPGEGIGLGLSISNSIVREYGGAINISSEIDSGTSIMIELPINNNHGK